MRVYISTDIEGVAGVVEAKQGNIDEGGAEFELGRRGNRGGCRRRTSRPAPRP
jgi:D-aminopeptidase